MGAAAADFYVHIVAGRGLFVFHVAGGGAAASAEQPPQAAHSGLFVNIPGEADASGLFLSHPHYAEYKVATNNPSTAHRPRPFDSNGNLFIMGILFRKVDQDATVLDPSGREVLF